MINLKIGEKYKLIGVSEDDLVHTIEGSIIEITTLRSSTFSYKILSGKVENSLIDCTHFLGFRYHAYCIPVDHGNRILPDLKVGDYIKSCRTEGTKAWEVTEDSYNWMITGKLGDLSDMRYATPKEQEEAISLSVVTDKGGQSWKEMMIREAMKRFPSPTSFADVNGRQFSHLDYDRPEFVDKKLVIKCPHRGDAVLWKDGKWATPSSTKEFRVNWPKSIDNFGISMPLVTISSPEVATNLIKKGFSEEEYFANPMNQKMELVKRKTCPQSVYNRIKF